MTVPGTDKPATPARPGLKVWRVTLGFLLAPIFPGFVIVPLFFIFAADATDLSNIFVAISSWTLLASFLTIPAALFLGVPLFFLFRWRGWLSWWAFALGGAALGLLIGAALVSVLFIVVGMISGGVSALTLWLCAFGDRKAMRLCGMVFGIYALVMVAAATLRSLLGM